MKIQRIVRVSFHGLPLIPIAIMAITIAGAVLAASTQIQSTATIQTFAMAATTLQGTTCTTTPLTSINYGIVPSGQPLPNTNFCLTNTSPSPVFTGGGTITAQTFSISGNLPPGITEDWIVGASNLPACVGMSMSTGLTVTAAAGGNVWTVTGSSVGTNGSCSDGSTISYFTLAHTGNSGPS